MFFFLQVPYDAVLSAKTPHSSLSAESWRWRVKRRNLSPRFASTTERKNENIQYFMFLSGNRTPNLLRLRSHVCAPAPCLAS